MFLARHLQSSLRIVWWSVVGREDEWKGTGRETKERSGGETKKARDKVARDSWPFSSGQANFHASLAIVRRLS